MVLASRNYEYGTGVLTGDMKIVPNQSGGVFLGSGACFEVSVVNLSGNGNMWIGGISGANAPVSGHGRILYGGGSITLRVDDVGKVKVCAEAASSGQLVSWNAISK